jgi:positive regulator of sigma E activity
MPEYEGYIATLKADGKAEVVIEPGSPGIPGVSGEVNRRVCHCTSGGSSFTVEALNPVGAQVGDQVVVSLHSGTLLRNAAAGLGPPLVGLTLAIALAWSLTHGFSRDFGAGLSISAALLFSGIIGGVLIFKRFSAENLPAIERIRMSRLEAASRFNNSSPFQDDCKDCHGCSPMAKKPIRFGQEAGQSTPRTV